MVLNFSDRSGCFKAHRIHPLSLGMFASSLRLKKSLNEALIIFNIRPYGSVGCLNLSQHLSFCDLRAPFVSTQHVQYLLFTSKNYIYFNPQHAVVASYVEKGYHADVHQNAQYISQHVVDFFFMFCIWHNPSPSPLCFLLNQVLLTVCLPVPKLPFRYPCSSPQQCRSWQFTFLRLPFVSKFSIEVIITTVYVDFTVRVNSSSSLNPLT